MMHARSRIDALFHGTAARQLHSPRHQEKDRGKEKDGRSARASGRVWETRRMHYVFIALLSWELLCHRNDF